MTILAFEKNFGFGLFIIDRQNHDGSRMANHITARPNSPGFLHLIGGDVEDRSLICDAGREDAGPR